MWDGSNNGFSVCRDLPFSERKRELKTMKEAEKASGLPWTVLGRALFAPDWTPEVQGSLVSGLPSMRRTSGGGCVDLWA